MDPSLMAPLGGFVQRGTDPLSNIKVPYFGDSYAGDIDQGFDDLEGALAWLGGKSADVPKNSILKAIDPSFPTVLGAATKGETTMQGEGELSQDYTEILKELPGNRSAVVCMKPNKVIEAVRSFFRDEVPAVVEEKNGPRELMVIAFLDFAAVHVTTWVHSSDPFAEAKATLTFKSTSQRDVVLCDKLWKAALDYFKDRQLPVTLPSGQAQLNTMPGLLDCGFDGFDDWDDLDGFDDMGGDGPAEDWTARVESALDAAASHAALVQEEGLQALAAWAAHRPDSRSTMAKALVQRPDLVARLLVQSVERLYPFAVVLEFTTARSGKDMACFAQQIETALGMGHPTIVEQSLLTAADNLEPHAAVAWTSYKELPFDMYGSEGDIYGSEGDGRKRSKDDMMILTSEAITVQRAASWSTGLLIDPISQACQARRPVGAASIGRVKTTGALPLLF